MLNQPTLAQRLASEALGTAFLLAAVVGSGIMAEKLSAGNVSLALLENTLATGAALIALILAFGSISGAHFNPAVTLADATQGGLSWRMALAYVFAQCLGAIVGVYAAHLMFGLDVIQISTHQRSGASQLFSEFVATFGLLATIWGCLRARLSAVPFAVGAYITSAYWFTASTSFANPAVTLARCFTNTFAGIRPQDAPRFILMQLLGALAATMLFRWLALHCPEPRRKSSFLIISWSRRIAAMVHTNVSGFVLAGGRSTRMGQDKAALTLNGRTLLEHALAILHGVCGDVAILGKRELYGGLAPVYEDIFPGCGPLGGIHAALTNSQTEYNLVIAVDTPFLQPEFLSYVAERAVESGAVVTTPEIAGYTQPLCAVYARKFLPIAEQALKSGDYKITPLFPKGQTLVIQEPELRRFAFGAEMFENLNTPEDMERARSRFSGGNS